MNQEELFNQEPVDPQLKLPKVGDKKWDGSLYSESDIDLIKSGNKNISEAFKTLSDVFKLPEGQIDKLEPFESYHDKLPFPELVGEMAQYYGNPHIMPEKQRAFVGIDNGVSGSIGIIYEDGTYEFFKTPVLKAQDYTKAKKIVSRVQPLQLKKILSKVGAGSMVLIERPMINSTRFNASMSAIRAFEATITILETLGLPYQIEDSKAWQKALLPKGITGEDLKSASKDIGNRMFPKTNEVKHTDCDGMLIAQYCKSKFR